jgi:hypothetical protein
MVEGGWNWVSVVLVLAVETVVVPGVSLLQTATAQTEHIQYIRRI